MFNLKPTRVATKDRDNPHIVHWANALGMWTGQSGAYEFSTEAEADRFIAFATTGFPAIDADTLREHGMDLVREEVR